MPRVLRPCTLMSYSVSTHHTILPFCDTMSCTCTVCALSETTVQYPNEGKEITATAFPWSTSAYVSFSSRQNEVSFTCKLDGEEPYTCEIHTKAWKTADKQAMKFFWITYAYIQILKNFTEIFCILHSNTGTSPWHHTGNLDGGIHRLTIRLRISVGRHLEAIETLTIPFRL